MSKLLKIIDRFFWLIITSIVIIILFSFYFTGQFDQFYQWFFNVSYLENGNLVTIATVFIGIYFSLYTFITSADSSSFLSRLSVSDLKKLVRMVNVGFVSSFSIVFFSFVNTEFYNLLHCKYIYFLFIIFLLLFGSAIQITLYYTLLFKQDIESKHKSFEAELNNQILDDELRRKLLEFLNKQK